MNWKVQVTLCLAVAILLLLSLRKSINLTALATSDHTNFPPVKLPKQNDFRDHYIPTATAWNETRALKLQNWLNHIYYFNSFVNPEAERFMESWLQPTRHLHIERVEEVAGVVASCDTIADDPRCNSLQESKRISQTYLRFGHAYKKGGTSLILHHDNIYLDLDELLRVVVQVELKGKISDNDDWGVIRLGCGVRHDPSRGSNGVIVEPASNAKDNLPCGRQSIKAILWRNGQLKKMTKLLTTFSGDDPNKMNIDCLLQRPEFERYTYCLDYPTSINMFQPPNPNLVVQPTPIFGTWNYGRTRQLGKQDIERVHQQMPYKEEREGFARLDRILYVNLAKNKLRRQFMESWLSRQSIPYRRVNGMSKNNVKAEDCAFGKTKEVCKGIVGYLTTLLNILEESILASDYSLQVVGNTMILEDDMLPSDSSLDRLVQAIKIVPRGWELIRFDCWGMGDFHFEWANPFVAATNSYTIKGCDGSSNATSCQKTFCGGGHSMVFSARGIEKLKLMWSTKP